MDFKKVFDFITSNNIDQQAVFDLVDEAKQIDLSDEEEVRRIIRKGAKVAKKEIDEETEDKIIKLVKEEGISPNLFKFL